MLRIIKNKEELNETIDGVKKSIDNMKDKLVTHTYNKGITISKSRKLFKKEGTKQSASKFIEDTIEIMKQIPLSSQTDSTQHFMSKIIENYKDTHNIKQAIRSVFPDSELSKTLEVYINSNVLNLKDNYGEGNNINEDGFDKLKDIYNELYNDNDLYRLIYTYQFLNSLKCGQDTSSVEESKV